MTKQLLAILTVPVLAMSANAQVVNGSFENTTFPLTRLSTSELGTGGYSTSAVSSSWTAGSSAGFYSGATTDGKIAGWLIPDGNRATNSTLTQNITLSAPGIYTLNFDSFSQNTNGGLSSIFSAALTGVGTQSFIEDADGVATARSVNFNVTTAGSYDLVFTGLNPSNFVYPATLIDNVSITAVPEPSSTALLGLGALGLFIRRKR